MSTPARVDVDVSPQSSLDRVLRALEELGRAPKVRGNHVQARCPLHDDRSPSLSVDWKADRGGMTRLHCFSCGADEEAILDAIGLRLTDRFDEPPRRPAHDAPVRSAAKPGNRLGPLPKRLTAPAPAAAATPVPWAIARTYDYVDEAGEVLGQVVRWERTQDGLREKKFTQRHPDGRGGWIDTAPTRRVLRHLPDVRAAIAGGAPVWLAEGEKDDEAINTALRGSAAEGAASPAGVATTNNCGAGGSATEQVAQLRGAHVVLVLDRDPAGWRRGKDLSNQLTDVAAGVRIVLPRPAQAKADAFDHFAAGHTLNEFVDISVDHVHTLVAAADAATEATRAGSYADLTQTALDEVRARLAAGQAAVERGAAKTADTEQRLAFRWAQEAARHVVAAGRAADQAWAAHQTVQSRIAELGTPSHPVHDLDDARRAGDALARAQRATQQAWDACRQPMPEAIREALARALPHEAPAPDPQPEPADDSSGTVVPFPGGGGGGLYRPGSPVRWTEYLRLPTGVIVERRIDRKTDTETLAGILNLDARILSMEYAEDESEAGVVDGTVVREQKVVSYVVGYTHPVTGELMSLQVSADRARSGEWLAELPVSQLRYDSSTRGRAKVWDAIRDTSTDIQVVTVYRSTGWREVPGLGWTYVHAGGGITAGGNRRVPVQLPNALSRIDLPTPTADPVELRDLFNEHSRGLMSGLLPHVGAVMAGTAFRSVLGWCGMTTALYGVPGTYKTQTSTLAMHHFGERWDRRGAAISLTSNGATLNALRELMHAAKDTMLFVDDAAPDKSIDAAATMLAMVSRMQANGEGRDRYDARNDLVREARRSRTTLLATTEVKASTVSGQERLNVVDLAKGDLELSNLIELDRPESRRGRAVVMASLLTWMAGRYPQLRDWAAARAVELAGLRRSRGAADRVAEPLAELQVGWEMISRFLVDVGAYTAEEAQAMLVEVDDALDDAGRRAVDPDSPNSLGERCRQFLVSALRAGTMHITYPGGITPAYPEALRYGYRRVSTGMFRDGEEQYRVDSRGEWAGVVVRNSHGHRLHVDPTVVMGAILSTARRADEPIRAGRTVLQRELAEVGLLRTEMSAGQVRYTCVVDDPAGDGTQTRMWDLDAERLFAGPDDNPEADPDAPVRGPLPYLPQLGAEPPAITPTIVIEEMGEEDSVKVNPATGQYDTTLLTPRQVCVGCGELTEIAYDNIPLHPACDPPPGYEADPVPPAAAVAAPAPVAPAGAPITTKPTSAPVPAAAAATVAARSPRPVGAATVAADSRPRGRTRGAESPWCYSAVVVDPDGLYLPDGTVAAPVTVTSIADLGRVADELSIGHLAGAGLVVLTQAMVEQLRLVAGDEVLLAPLANGDAPSDDDFATRIQQFLAEQTWFLSNDEGWTADRDLVAPWMRIRRDGRTVRVVLEPYVWIWDRRGEESAGPFAQLPDPTVDAVACWRELARRLERLGELLGTPWATSPAATGEQIFDAINRARGRDGGRQLTAACELPALSNTGQGRLEDEYIYSRRPSRSEADAVQFVHRYDRRGSYLATAGGIDLGYGTPEHFAGAEADGAVSAAIASGSKLPFGLWRITLPVWEQPGPPPHPHQTLHQPVQRWVTTATLRLLLDDDTAGGPGYTVADLLIGEAWVWPAQARFLEPWYRKLKTALLAAREDGDEAVARAIKGTYTGYIGRMASVWTARGARPWHHQPAWEASIRASARAALWRAANRHRLATARNPIGIDRDEIGYLDTNIDPRINPPAADNGRLGALKPSGTVALTVELRKQLQGGSVSAMSKLLPTVGEESGGD